MPRFLMHVVLIGLAVAFVKPVTAEVLHYPHHSVHKSGEVTLLLWISADILNAETPPAEFPGGWWPAVERLRDGLRRVSANRPVGPGNCLPPGGSEPVIYAPSAKAKPAPTDYAVFLATSAIALVAEVETVESGYMMIGEGEISPRVRVYVTEVLRDVEGSISPGDEVTYIGTGGPLRLGANELCGTEDPHKPVPTVGARIVLTAYSPTTSDSPPLLNHVTTSSVFTLDGEELHLPTGTRFKQREFFLDKLRSAVALATKNQKP